ncbi:MAG: pilus assembly protein [Comamonadaceae bacterium]|nr:pilus assembly protein [Comamonadaceae bacterium]
MTSQFEWKSRSLAAATHLSVSLVVALLAAAMVFLVWFPYPFQEVSGGGALFKVVVVVDVVLGPVLTWVVFDRRKPRAELALDLSIIVALQLAALAYGLWSVYQARPVYLVHEVDRFVVVSAADIDPADLTQASPEFQHLPWTGIKLIGVRESRDGEERLQTLALALAGKDVSLRPNYWQTLSDANKEVIRQRAKPLQTLRDRSKSDERIVNQWLNNQSRPLDQLVFLPMVGRDQYWSTVLDASNLDIVGYLPIDGF